MNDTYRSRLQAMCENDKLYKAVLFMNHEFLELRYQKLHLSGTTTTGTAALKEVQQEMGVEHG